MSAAVFPICAIAPPTVRSSPYRISRRRLVQRRRKLKRMSTGGGPGGGGEDEGFLGGDGGGGPYGGDGGSGKGWNFWGSKWDDSSSSSDFALDFLYEVIVWIALSNCVHFAFKRALQIYASGIGDDSREKVPMRLT